MTLQISPVTDADVEAIASLARIVWQDAYPGIITQAQIDFMPEPVSYTHLDVYKRQILWGLWHAGLLSTN